jgi:7-carboxy-7-deazaguanine synthase
VKHESVEKTLPLMEHFYTIQGEGFHQGRAAYFIRLAGCDVGCVWCDVKESWDADKYERYDVDHLTALVKGSGAKLVVITGGEPLMYNLDFLTRSLHESGFEVNIETSGAYPLSGNWDCISKEIQSTAS